MSWRAHLYDVCPDLQSFLDDFDIAEEDTNIKLCLPSDFNANDRLKYKLERHSACELDMRRGEAFDIIRSLRTTVRILTQYNYKAHKERGVKLATTRMSRAFREAKMLKEFWMSEYRLVY